MWELDSEESSWVAKNWCFWTVVLEKTLESPLDCKEIQPVHPKGDQSWIFIGRTDAEAETPILWPPDLKNWLIWKAPEGRRRGWQRMDGIPTGWTRVWVNSGSWWWTGRPGMLQSMGSQSQTWLTELNWTESVKITFICIWKQKNLCNSLCCCICCLAVVWNWTCHISEVCLYLPAADNVGVSDSSHSVSNWCSSFVDSPSTPHFLPLLLVVNQWLWGRMEAKLPLLAYAPALPLKDLGLRCTLTWLNSPPDVLPRLHTGLFWGQLRDKSLAFEPHLRICFWGHRTSHLALFEFRKDRGR